MKPIDIILVTFNRLEFTKKTLKSIQERTKIPYNLIVVDNNSTDGTRDFLISTEKDYKKVVLLDENIGLEMALNEGFKYVESDIFVTTDNDCIAPMLEPCWLRRQATLMDFYKDFGAISLRPQVLIGVGPIFNSDKLVVENNVAGGSYRMMRKQLVKHIGGWTKKFENDGRGNEEHDISSKIRQAGFKVGYAKHIWCYHMFGEEGTWGYSKDSNYKMGRYLDRSPEDQEYDLLTCEPKIHSNE